MIAFKLQCLQRDPLFSEEQWQTIADRLELPGRALQIVRLVFEDAADPAIAAELAISVNTVHTHLKRLYLKHGVTNRAGLVLLIVRAHLADAREVDNSEPTVRLRPAARKAA